MSVFSLCPWSVVVILELCLHVSGGGNYDKHGDKSKGIVLDKSKNIFFLIRTR